MEKSVLLPASIAATLLVAGCTALGPCGLEPGRSSEADVLRSLGEPAMTFPTPDGGRQLVFPQGPMGSQTFMARVGADGRLARLDQVLDEEHFRRIESGRTTTGELERLIGPPWRRIAFPNLRQVAWDYHFEDAWGYDSDLSVMVDERGVVAGVIAVRRERDRSDP